MFNRGAVIGADDGDVFNPNLINRSVWFDGSADHILLPFTTESTDRIESTFACFLQRLEFGRQQAIFGVAGNSEDTDLRLRFDASDRLELIANGVARFRTNRRFRDSAPYSFIVSLQGDAVFATFRARLYVNGVLQDDFETFTSPGLTNAGWGLAEDHYIGRDPETATDFLKAYLSQVVFLDGVSIQGSGITLDDLLGDFQVGESANVRIPRTDFQMESLARNNGGNSFALTSGIANAQNSTFLQLSNLSPGDISSSAFSSAVAGAGSTIMNRTPSGPAASRQEFTLSFWARRTDAPDFTTVGSAREVILSQYDSMSGDTDNFGWDTNGRFGFDYHTVGGSDFTRNASPLILDADWHHYLVSADLASGVTDDLVFYVDGTESGTFTVADADLEALLNGGPMYINAFWDGMTETNISAVSMAQVAFIGNRSIQQGDFTIANFGQTIINQFDSQWEPRSDADIKLLVDAGEATHSFLLTTGIQDGTDASIHANNFTSPNSSIRVTYDTPSNRLPLFKNENNSAPAIPANTQGSTTAAFTSQAIVAEVAFSDVYSGPDSKLYFEVADFTGVVGIANATAPQIIPFADPGPTSLDSFWLIRATDGFVANGSGFAAHGSASLNDTLRVAIDVPAGKLFFGNSLGWFNSGDPVAGTGAAFENIANQIFRATCTDDTNTFRFSSNEWAFSAPTGFSEWSGRSVGRYPAFTPVSISDPVNGSNHTGSKQYALFPPERDGFVSGGYEILNGGTETNGISGGGTERSVATMYGASSGKFYFEWETPNPVPVLSPNLVALVNDFRRSDGFGLSGGILGRTENSWALLLATGNRQHNSVSSEAYANTDLQALRLGFAIDLDAGKWYVRNNLGYLGNGDPIAGTNAIHDNLSGTIRVATTCVGDGTSHSGARIFMDSDTWSFDAPVGYREWSSNNLPTAEFHGGESYSALLWTGDGSTANQARTGAGFEPNMSILCARDLANSILVNQDTFGLPGNSFFLQANSIVQPTLASGEMFSFDTDGFTTRAGGLNQNNVNQNTIDFAAYLFGGGTPDGVANNDGTVTSTVTVPDHGAWSFSTYVGTGALPVTVGHGLGGTPEWVIIKQANGAVGNWYMRERNFALNTNVLAVDIPSGLGALPSTIDMDDTVVTLGGSTFEHNFAGRTYLMWTFRSVPGVAATFSLEGKGLGGTFENDIIEFDFKPEFVLMKNQSINANWILFDTARNPTNVGDNRLFYRPSVSSQEFTGANANIFNGANETIDMFGNSIMMRTDAPAINQAGNTILGLAIGSRGGNGRLPLFYGV